jgi:TRAP-type C4-dicarboxylate transport system substrate-binding protein
MVRPTARFSSVLALVLSLSASRAEAQVTIKLATLAPSGSAWHDLLKELAVEWERVSEGRVRVRVYPGGAQGNEGEMVRKLRIGQLQAAALSNIGLHDVTTEAQALSIPLLFRDEGELRCALDREKGALEAALAKQGLVAIQWGVIGAVSFFCNAPVRTPAELGRLKLFAWEGDPGSVEALRQAGLQPVVLSSTDLVPALQTGMVDCVGNVPLYVLTARLFERARYLTDLPWGYLVGATVVRQEAWERIPAELRPRLLAEARRLGARVDAEVHRLNLDAVEAMRRQGLTLVSVDPAAWRPALERSWPALRGPVIPAPFFDEMVGARDACRGGRVQASR